MTCNEELDATVVEARRREDALRMVNEKWDAELRLTSPVWVSAHDKEILHQYIANKRTIELTECEIDHCKRMIAIQALG